MNLDLTEDQKMIQDTARNFAKSELEPVAAKLDEADDRPIFLKNLKKLAELGLMGVAVPEIYGGAGMDNLAYVLAMEEISVGCASTGVIMSVNNSLVCWGLEEYGTEEQKERMLRPLAMGPIVNTAQAAGFELRDVHIAEPSLETLFLHHTGRSLRD